ncbi:MAG TPA: LacI family DNA-binding transcriptional regulator, partial [Candidatus Methylacidiphilales bacterium]
MTKGRKPSMADIAKAVGLSKNTVSLALRNSPQIPAATRERIAKAARRLGYRKNPTVSHLMAVLRSDRSPRFQANLAVINAHQDRDAFRSHPTIPTYLEGCRRRARDLGYGIESFWLHDPELDGPRLLRILRARGIRGIVIIGLMRENRLPERFLPVWEAFPTAVTGVRTVSPSLPFACTDHHALALAAFEQALRAGY